jgi:hypothetical protein
MNDTANWKEIEQCSVLTQRRVADSNWLSV